MKAEELLKQRYAKRFGDKWDRVAKQFDYYDMTDFAESYAKEVIIEFQDFLLKNGYCDTDVYTEPPTALDQFFAQQRRNNKL